MLQAPGGAAVSAALGLSLRADPNVDEPVLDAHIAEAIRNAFLGLSSRSETNGHGELEGTLLDAQGCIGIVGRRFHAGHLAATQHDDVGDGGDGAGAVCVD